MTEALAFFYVEDNEGLAGEPSSGWMQPEPEGPAVKTVAALSLALR